MREIEQDIRFMLADMDRDEIAEELDMDPHKVSDILRSMYYRGLIRRGSLEKGYYVSESDLQ